VIRYPIAPGELEDRIRVQSESWLRRAARKTEQFRQARRYQEASSIWSEIKPVFLHLQHEKCAFCERRLAGGRFGSIEHDVEHYRPKSKVQTWPTPEIARERKIAYDFATGGDLPEGYYLLACQSFNYAVACKTCNNLKASFFPVGAGRVPDSDSPAALAAEMPFLLFPLGAQDEDPEEILTFDGLSPIPKALEVHRMRRAIVTIDVFALAEREELLRGRAERIYFLHMALTLGATGDPTVQESASRAVASLLSPASEHTNCARAFHRLYDSDRARADEIARMAQSYLESQS
jgi:hypothetical protein